MDLSGVQKIVERGVQEGVFPGAAWAVGNSGGVHIGFSGRFSYEASSRAVSAETLWDLASLTKVVATTSIAMALYEIGVLDLARSVSDILPEFPHRGVRIRNLLLHDSGLAASAHFHESGLSPEEIKPLILGQPLVTPVGEVTTYSDLGFIILGWALEALSGDTLSALTHQTVLGPLGMASTTFNPDPAQAEHAAPTEPVEPWRAATRKAREVERAGVYIQGEVHDPTAMALGGVAGQAGLFSTIEDVARFAVATLKLNPDTLKLFTTQASDQSSRALGWDTNWKHASSAGSSWPEDAFGHTGFTGTSIWLDGKSGEFAVLLSNRVHPTADNVKIKAFRPAFHEAVRRSLQDQ
jgi:CubicO group peptidase (beta-lactamase class C family)